MIGKFWKRYAFEAQENFWKWESGRKESPIIEEVKVRMERRGRGWSEAVWYIESHLYSGLMVILFLFVPSLGAKRKIGLWIWKPFSMVRICF